MPTGDMQWIMSFAGKYPSLDIIAIFFAEYLPYIIILLFVAGLLLQKDVRRRLYVIFVSGLSIIVSMGIIREALNYFLYRPRPFVVYNITPLISHEATASFPSGHATTFFTIATLIFLFMSRRWGTWVYVAAGLIGLARVYAGLHYPLDIIGGAMIGVLIPFIIRMALLPPRIAAALAPQEQPPLSS